MLRFWIAATARGRFSDGAIICGTPSAPPHDRHAATNPTVVLEVLSPSSIGDDEGDKRSDFQSLETIGVTIEANGASSPTTTATETSSSFQA